MKLIWKKLFIVYLLLPMSCLAGTKNDLYALASIYQGAWLSISQPYSYYLNLPQIKHNQFLANTPQALTTFRKQEDDIYGLLKAIKPQALQNTKERIFYLKFREFVEANKGVRICRDELWRMDPAIAGAHLLIDHLVGFQPVNTIEDRQQALQRWRSIEDYYQQEIVNLKEGLRLGYTAPKRVVQRVVQQINHIVEIDIDSHPYLQLAQRSSDKKFQQEFKTIINKNVLPALKNYADYLQKDYLLSTRESLSLDSNTDGRQCYIAKYRYYTSLQRTAQEVYDLGLKTVNRHEQEVITLAQRVYGVSTFEEALAKVKNDRNDKFSSADSMHRFYQQVVARATQAMPRAFKKLPEIGVKVEPVPAYLQGTGVSAHYKIGSVDSPGKFIYDPTTYKDQAMGSAEILAVHEGYPGHHLQLSLAQEQSQFHPIERLFGNSAYVEGWARYAEALSEELDIYQRKSTLIYRRAWPARGMVVDTGLHMQGWSNDQVKFYIARSGYITDVEQMLDRIAAVPAQLTAYDSGALEIFALRTLAEKKLGNDFDLRAFHSVVLKNEGVPLPVLRKRIKLWLNNREGE